jgi:hypothetical protein
MKITHLSHKSIDYERWDKSVTDSGNGLIYGKSWYLNIVSPGWEALVTDNFEYILPIPVKRKYKIPYIVQPFLTQQLGIFSSKPIDSNIIKQFIRKLPSYSYELNLNEKNEFKDSTEHPNYVLNLDQTYNILQKSFSKNTLRNIKLAEKHSLLFLNHISKDEFLAFYNSVKRNFLSIDAVMLGMLIDEGIERKEFRLYAIANQDNRIIAALCLSEFNNRITYLLPVSSDEGKDKSAMFMMLDVIIRNEAGSGKLLDFEGSKIEGIARFYKGFGAVNRPYYTIKNLRPAFLIGRIN